MNFETQHSLVSNAADLLSEHGFDVGERVLPELAQPLMIVESKDAVAAVLGAAAWPEIQGLARDAGVALVNWAAPKDQTTRRWDLYLVVLLELWPEPGTEAGSIERFQADTSLVRNVVRAGVTPGDLGRMFDALGALLPLNPVTHAASIDLSRSLVDRLRVHGVDGDLADQAVQSFIRSGKVFL